MIHGGPHSFASGIPGLSYDKGFILNEGYAMLFPNYRGSISKGLKFLRSQLGEMEKHKEDVIEQID